VARSRLLQQIPVADVLAFSAHVLESRDVMLGQRIEIASDQLTADEAAAVVSRLLGRHLEVAEPPPGHVSQLSTWLEHAGTAVDIAGLRHRYPHIGWHHFADWATSQAWHPRLHPRHARRQPACLSGKYHLARSPGRGDAVSPQPAVLQKAKLAGLEEALVPSWALWQGRGPSCRARLRMGPGTQ